MKLFRRFKKAAPTSLGLSEIMKLAAEVEAMAVQGVVRAEEMQRRSVELSVPAEHLYAGLGSSLHTSMEVEHELQFVVCVGNCRDRGSMECVSALLEIKEKRASKSLPIYDLVPRQCLSRCQEGPVVEIRSKDGNAVMAAASPKELARAVKELLD